MMSEASEPFLWWKHGVIYHIYPQSFKDTNGDGIGDLEGIIQKLDYLSDLGIDAIWLSPIYQSPLVDAGYDISYYKSINPIYGSMDDFKRLLNLAHQKGIKIIMDLVLNHTSGQHPWFLESRSSVDNPKRDWYIWQAPSKNGKRPNNWRTNFGQRAWTLDPTTNEYYYHSFFKEQPDLNWRNQEVKEKMFVVVRFWLDMGVDGFRLDVINMIFKNEQLTNNPITHFFSNTRVNNRNQPEVYEFLRDFRQLLDQYPDKTSVGEIYTPPPGDSMLAASYLGNGNDMLHMAFDFSFIFSRWSARQYYQAITNYYNTLPKGGWPCFVISNHDLGRSIKRWLFSFRKYHKAKVLAVLLLTLKGTPFIYYGDEIGMENVSIPKKEIKDMYGKLFYPFYKGRDSARTPMQWNDEEYAGFSDAKPWLPVHSNYQRVNVESELQDENSIYTLYKRLIELRKEHPVLQHGEIEFLNNGNGDVLAYKRLYKNEKVTIILNFSSNQNQIFIPDIMEYNVLFSIHNRESKMIGNNMINLKPFGGLILYMLQNT